jgi:LPXTG-motif cell wall-anchored protein
LFIAGSILALSAGTAGAQTGEAGLVAGTPIVSPAPLAGGTSTYNIDVTNAGPENTTNVRIQTNFNLSGDDSLLTLGGASVSGGTCNIAGPRVAVCNVPALNVGQSASVSVTFSLAPTATGTITVNGTITSDLLDPNPDNFSSTGALPIDPPPTTPAPPTTAPPAIDPPVTTAVPEVPRPPATQAPASVPEAVPTQLPSTGTPATGVVILGLVGLAAGVALVLVGRGRRSLSG